MPTTLSTISNTTVKVRWQEPYASDGLNRKVAVAIPSGVYRGLRLSVSASNLSVDLIPDPTFGDHVAVQESFDGHSTTYRDDTSGPITLSLAGYSTGDVVVLTLYIVYLSGSTTTAEFRAYLLSEYNSLTTAVKAGLVVLGTVLRPASGIIPAANIVHDRRKIPFLQRTDESTPWNPLIRNGGFELGQTNGTYRHSSPFWKSSLTNANFMFRPVETEAHSGVKSLELTTSAAGAVVATIQQDLWMPVVPGRLVMGRLYKKAIQTATSTPTGRMRFLFGDKDGLNDTQDDLVFATTPIDGAFVEFDGIVQVPTGMRVLKSVQIIISGTYAAAGPCIRIDDVGAWAQVDGADWLDVRDARVPETAVGDMFLGAANAFNNASAKLSFDGTLINIERRDEDLSLLPPAISIQARTTGSIEYTLLFQSIPAGGQGYRKYMAATGRMVDVVNASYNNTTNLWAKDVNGQPAYKQEVSSTGFATFSRLSDAAWSDSSWIQHIQTYGSEITTGAVPSFAPALTVKDAGGNQRSIVDHNGMPGSHVIDYNQAWLSGNTVNGTVNEAAPNGWTFATTGTGAIQTLASGNVSIPLRLSFTTGNTPGDASFIYTNVYIAQSYPSVENNPLNNVLNVLEWSAMNVNFTNEPNFQCGWNDIVGGNKSGFFFRKNTADTTWKVYLQDAAGASSVIDTLIAPGPFAGADHLFFRLEMYGANLPGGKRFLAYINGALVAAFTGADPHIPTEPMRALFRMFLTGTNGNNFFLGGLRWRCTERLSDDVL